MGMHIKKFQAPTLQKALEQIRAELGDGAIVLQADPIKTGLLGRHGVEVTAAIDRKVMGPRFEVKVEDSVQERSAAAPKKEANPKRWKGLFSKPEASAPSPAVKKPAASRTEQVKNFVAQAAQSTEAPGRGQVYAMKTFVEPLQKELQELKAKMASETKKPTDRAPSTALLESEIQSLKNEFKTFMYEQKLQNSALSEEFCRLEMFWRDRGMTSPQIAHFIGELEKAGKAFDEPSLQSALEKKVQAAKSFDSRSKKIVVLVGPTGVGKTTTIAKLAAFEKLKLNRSAALVTLDDFKIGGADQLGHYARILGVPFFKCRSDISLEEQVKAIEADTIYIDTFGISPKDDAKMTKLRRALTFKDPALRERQELHLALPTGIASGDVDLYLQSFSRMNPNYLLFTKWDETENWGGMLAAILMSDRPVSFVGHGQEVPDDISIFNSQEFIETVTNWEN